VLSVTVYLAGPFLSMTLARFGAEVIKVEAPGSGDPARNLGPFAGPRGIAHDRGADDVSIPFLKRSEGVKCVTLNLKDAEGRRMFLDLAKKTDVLIENLAPGSMSRLGLGYGDVSAVNPGIVYCSIAGYGQSGPYKDLPAHDHQIQAMSGVMDMNGDPDGPPMRVGLYVADLVTPLYAALGIYGALRVKERTGKGQHIDASMIDTLAALMFMEPVEFVAAQGLPVRVGNRARDDVTGLYRLKDGDVFITIVNEGRWQRLCNTIGVAELIDDPRYATVALRKERLPELRDIVQARLGRLTCEQGIAPAGECRNPGLARAWIVGSVARRAFQGARNLAAHATLRQHGSGRRWRPSRPTAQVLRWRASPTRRRRRSWSTQCRGLRPPSRLGCGGAWGTESTRRGLSRATSATSPSTFSGEDHIIT